MKWTLLLMLLLLLLPLAHAGEQERVRQAVAEGRLQPLSDIMSTVRQRYPGRVTDVELEHEDGRYVYEIDVLGANRQEVEIRVDGASGAILEADQEQRHVAHPLPQLLRQVLAQYPGRVVGAEYQGGLYEVEIIRPDGSRIHLRVDPVDARIIARQKHAGPRHDMQSMPQLLEAVLRQYPGTVLEAELEHGPDGSYYEFEIRQRNGETVSLHVDARSGRILRTEED